MIATIVHNDTDSCKQHEIRFRVRKLEARNDIAVMRHLLWIARKYADLSEYPIGLGEVNRTIRPVANGADPQPRRPQMENPRKK